MKCQNFFNILGLSFNIIGTIVLAFTYNKYNKTINESISSTESWEGIELSPDIIDNEYEKNKKDRNDSLKYSSKLTYIGIGLILIGFFLQGVALFV